MKSSESLYNSGGAALTDELETEYGSIVCEKTLRYQSIMVDEKTRERLDRLPLPDDSFFRLVMKDRPECITLLITVILGKHDMDVDEVILHADDHSVEHTGRLSLMFWETITMWKYRMEERDHHIGG